jgi:hypothetical protein
MQVPCPKFASHRTLAVAVSMNYMLLVSAGTLVFEMLLAAELEANLHLGYAR